MPQPHIKCKIPHPCFKKQISEDLYIWEPFILMWRMYQGFCCWEKASFISCIWRSLHLSSLTHDNQIYRVPSLAFTDAWWGWSSCSAQSSSTNLTHTQAHPSGVQACTCLRLWQLCTIPMLGPLGRKQSSLLLLGSISIITPPAKMPSSVIAAGCGWSGTRLSVWFADSRGRELISYFQHF